MTFYDGREIRLVRGVSRVAEGHAIARRHSECFDTVPGTRHGASDAYRVVARTPIVELAEPKAASSSPRSALTHRGLESWRLPHDSNVRDLDEAERHQGSLLRRAPVRTKRRASVSRSTPDGPSRLRGGAPRRARRHPVRLRGREDHPRKSPREALPDQTGCRCPTSRTGVSLGLGPRSITRLCPRRSVPTTNSFVLRVICSTSRK